jgi:hypothetical protein
VKRRSAALASLGKSLGVPLPLIELTRKTDGQVVGQEA